MRLLPVGFSLGEASKVEKLLGIPVLAVPEHFRGLTVGNILPGNEGSQKMAKERKGLFFNIGNIK